MKHALTIAGSDSGGGAGIQADLKTFAALGVYGMSVITAVTAQNTVGVFKVAELDPEMVKAQIDAIFSDIRVDAVKIGMVSNAEIIRQIAASLREWGATNIVVDPVMVSKSGHRLLNPEAIEALKNELLPLAAIVTPNLPEAAELLGHEVPGEQGMEEAARKIHALGAKSVLVKGGHLEGEAVDVLFDGTRVIRLANPRLKNNNTHGTGCTLSSAIAAYIARGCELEQAVAKAKEYLTGAIENGFSVGHGVGPVHHFYRLYSQSEK